MLRPVAVVFRILISTWVLADTRRRRLSFYSATAWTLGALLFPLIILPLYLAVRIIERPHQGVKTEENKAGENAAAPEIIPDKQAPPPAWSRLWPLAYALTLTCCCALYFYADYESFDAHLARAAGARLLRQSHRTIHEYQAALVLRDDPHTHKLLAIEFANTKQWNDALEEYRAAERGGEADDLLPYYTAVALDALNRPTEAMPEYREFLRRGLCRQPLPDARCSDAQARLEAANKLASTGAIQ